MKSGKLQLALRETRGFLARWPVLTGAAVIVVILVISGPFGTGDALTILPRLLYWAAVALLTFPAGVLVNRLVAATGGPGAMTAVLATLASGLAATGIVLALNAVTFAPGAGVDWPVVARILAVAVLVAAAFHFRTAQTTQEPPSPPSFLDRLPLDKRGPLVSISVQDHYVEVVTTRGRDLLLMRLGDAIRETGATKGLQVHRSHWVALDQVQAARREGERAVLTMTSGHEIPVSRTYVPAVREAGLLPRGKERT
ncbi:LytTr DNA-binding domain-containing protein [Lutimaribacter pacificus]|uniref:Transcriptional regulator, LytTR family n=1 Tax=Lutimaribacter pacificus TaxID=391948 RepID=A0A1H0JPQ2_9RHOB|nr:LytTR family DNA-binding domain-containing protein [Lutimaribacter pacificus]SDO45726.1 LytTr DNA-binding domain-containing protein [Lutimaribacter pacificus]SHK07740.1 transcriptional regulator, LytTR family [Lutimaribacter pacificus]